MEKFILTCFAFVQYTEYGNEGSIFLLQTCLDQINLHAENVQTIPMKAAIVSSVLKFLMLKPNFSTVFCESLRNTWSQSDDMFLENLLKDLNLSVSEKIAISLALTDSQISEFRIRGILDVLHNIFSAIFSLEPSYFLWN